MGLFHHLLGHVCANMYGNWPFPLSQLSHQMLWESRMPRLGHMLKSWFTASQERISMQALCGRKLADYQRAPEDQIFLTFNFKLSILLMANNFFFFFLFGGLSLFEANTRLKRENKLYLPCHAHSCLLLQKCAEERPLCPWNVRIPFLHQLYNTSQG